MKEVKAVFITIGSALMSWLGILAVPVFIMVGCNLIDYFTGLCAAKYRNEEVNSYKGIRGIIKKICMWLLVLVGWMVDMAINYASTYAGLGIRLPYIVATIVAVWIVFNEIISILENMLDIGVSIPPFLLPLAKKIRKQVEDVAGQDKEDETNESDSTESD